MLTQWGVTRKIDWAYCDLGREVGGTVWRTQKEMEAMIFSERESKINKEGGRKGGRQMCF